MKLHIGVLGGFAALVCLGVESILIRRTTNERNAEHYIVDSEQQWAASTTIEDTIVVTRILADDFVGIAMMETSTRKPDRSQTRATFPKRYSPIASTL